MGSAPPFANLFADMPNMRKPDATSSIDSLDLRQLRFLQTLLTCTSITQAGEMCGMSQPAASRTLARLRAHLGDPLLVRKRNGFVLSAQAHALEEPLKQALDLLDKALSPNAFDSAKSRRVFRLASTDYGVFTVANPCLSGLASQAPTIALRIDPWSASTLLRLEQGDLDFALFADAPIPGDFHYRNLFREHYVLLGPAVHPVWEQMGPAVKDMAALELASAYPHFAVRYPKGAAHETDDPYARLGLPSPAVRLEVPYFNVNAEALASGGLLALLPSRVVSGLLTSALIRSFRVEAPQLAFDYRLIWHARSHRDAGSVWLRQFIGQACR